MIIEQLTSFENNIILKLGLVSCVSDLHREKTLGLCLDFGVTVLLQLGAFPCHQRSPGRMRPCVLSGCGLASWLCWLFSALEVRHVAFQHM
jgi:hypothetical protein